MDFQVSPFSLTTALLLAFTLGLIAFRYLRKLESNWPLIYYVFLVAYQKTFPASLSPNWVYVGVVTALFLRFEFMGSWVVRFFRLVELVVLGYILWHCLGLIVLL